MRPRPRSHLVVAIALALLPTIAIACGSSRMFSRIEGHVVEVDGSTSREARVADLHTGDRTRVDDVGHFRLSWPEGSPVSRTYEVSADGHRPTLQLGVDIADDPDRVADPSAKPRSPTFIHVEQPRVAPYRIHTVHVLLPDSTRIEPLPYLVAAVDLLDQPLAPALTGTEAYATATPGARVTIAREAQRLLIETSVAAMDACLGDGTLPRDDKSASIRVAFSNAIRDEFAETVLQTLTDGVVALDIGEPDERGRVQRMFVGRIATETLPVKTSTLLVAAYEAAGYAVDPVQLRGRDGVGYVANWWAMHGYQHVQRAAGKGGIPALEPRR